MINNPRFIYPIVLPRYILITTVCYACTHVSWQPSHPIPPQQNNQHNHQLQGCLLYKTSSIIAGRCTRDCLKRYRWISPPWNYLTCMCTAARPNSKPNTETLHPMADQPDAVVARTSEVRLSRKSRSLGGEGGASRVEYKPPGAAIITRLNRLRINTY